MKRFVVVMDYVAQSINELVDLVLHTIIFAFIVIYVFGGAVDVGYALFFVIPIFILCSPLLYKLHPKTTVEWLIKTPIYLAIGFIVHTLSYLIGGYNMDVGRTSGWTTFVIVLVVIQGIWVRSSLKRVSKPPKTLEERRERSRKRMLVSFVFSMGAIIVSIASFAYVVSPMESSAEWSGLGVFASQVIGGFSGVLFALLGIVMFLFFVFSIFDRS